METIVCRRCGHTGPGDARYCARCGLALTPLRVRTTGTIQRLLDNLSPRTIALLGLIALVPIGLLVEHLLIDVGLYLPFSLVLLALVTGSGCAYLGWYWFTPTSGRHRLIRVLLVLAGLGLSLVAIRWIDRASLSTLAGNGQTIVSDIPGVHLEAVNGLNGLKRVHRVSSPPPYWLFFVIYATLTAIAGNLIHRAYIALVIREREVRSLRESLLAQTQDAAIQQERNRLARELHDSIKQQIFSINISAAAAQARWESDPQGVQAALGDVRRSAQEVMVEMSALLQQLSPVPLEKVGLRQALRDQCEALGYRTGAEVVAEFGELPDDDRLPPGAQESLFRIAQEALSNVARHARAGQVRLYLGQRETGSPLVLEIQDDGQGFDVAADHGGMGLDNVRQRVQVLGGELEIESAPGAGTRIHASVPLLSPAARRAGDGQLYGPDHTLNRTLLVGFGGGLALVVALFYPLYVLLPGRYADGWGAGSSALGFLLGIVAVGLVVATGLLAARWAGADTRQGGLLHGALAGGVAGAIFFFALGGVAAAVAGNAPLLAHGLTLAASEAEAMRLLSEAVIGITWGVYGAFWAALLAGTGLGAIGGLLAPPTGVAPARLDPRLLAISILGAGGLFSALTLCASLAVFGLLETALHRASAEYALDLRATLPLPGVTLWPIGTQLVLYLVSLAALYALLRVEARSSDPARFGAVFPRTVEFSLLTLAVPLYTWFVALDPIELTPALRVLFVLVAASSLALAGLYLALSIEVHRRRQARGLYRSSPIRLVAVAGVLLSLAALAWAVNRSTLVSLVVASVVIAASLALMVVLWRQRNPPAASVADLVHGQLSLSQAISAGLGLMVAIALPLMPLVSIMSSGLSITLQFPPVLFGDTVSGQLSPPETTLAQLIHEAYSTQATAVLLTFVGASVLVGLLLAIIGGRMALVRWRVTQDAEAGE
jgi:signal transduction histidine kinase